jgi:hypothetical protein
VRYTATNTGDLAAVYNYRSKQAAVNDTDGLQSAGTKYQPLVELRYMIPTARGATFTGIYTGNTARIFLPV